MSTADENFDYREVVILLKYFCLVMYLCIQYNPEFVYNESTLLYNMFYG